MERMVVADSQAYEMANAFVDIAHHNSAHYMSQALASKRTIKEGFVGMSAKLTLFWVRKSHTFGIASIVSIEWYHHPYHTSHMILTWTTYLLVLGWFDGSDIANDKLTTMRGGSIQYKGMDQCATQ
jgi:hypothetical protein